MTESIKNTLNDIKITSDEINRLKTAFKDPEFRKLFNEYAEELADPENRKKYESEIIQLENERGFDTIFINPDPHYVLKTRHWPDSRDTEECKIFINVCSCDKLQEPDISADKSRGSSGISISLPHSFAPPREDVDKAKNAAKVIDVVFHPKAFELARRDKKVCDLLNVTAVEGVQKQFSLRLGFSKDIADKLSDAHTKNKREELLLKSFHILKGIKYKGMPRSTIMRKAKPNKDEIVAKNLERDQSELEEAPHLIKLRQTGKDLQAPSEKDETDSPKRPKYKITHGKSFQLSDCMPDPALKNTNLPDYLKLDVDLVGLTSASQFDLDLTQTHLHIKSMKPVRYDLDLKLPFPVIEPESSAKFDKSLQKLTLTMPVKKSSIIEQLNISVNHSKICDGMSKPLTEHSILPDDNPPSLVVPISPCSNSKNSRFVVSPSPDVKLIHKPTSSSVDEIIINRVSSLHLSTPKDHRLMPAKFRQDPTTFTVVFCVKNALPSSVCINWAPFSPVPNRSLGPSGSSSSFTPLVTPLTFAVKLQSRSSGGCTSDWGLVLKCPIYVQEAVLLATDHYSSGDEGLTGATNQADSNDSAVSQDRTDQNIDDPDADDRFIPVDESNELAQKPKLLACNVNPHNVVMVFEKPRPPSDSEFATHTWWPAIATGRSIGAGMEVSEFHGLLSCISMPMPRLNSPFESPRSSLPASPSNGPSYSGVTSTFANILSAPHLTAPSQPKCTFVVQEMSSDRICVQRNNGLSEHTSSTAVENEVLIGSKTWSSIPQMSEPATECQIDKPRKISQEEHSHSVQGSSSANNLMNAPVRGILKQRTLSADQSETNPLYPPGLGIRDTSRRRVHSICVDGLPSNKIDSNAGTGFSSSSRDSSTNVYCQCVCGESISCCVAAKGSLTTRQRMRSVNFSRKDDSMDFCPQDSVDALHHSIMNRRKKAKKYERRRHHSFSDTTSTTQEGSSFSTQTGSIGSQKNPRKKRKQKKGKQLHFHPEVVNNKANVKTCEITNPLNLVNDDGSPQAETKCISSLTAEVIFELDES